MNVIMTNVINILFYKQTLTQQESYALTCRINEKRVLERSFAHYDEQLYVCIDDDDEVLGTISNKRSRTVQDMMTLKATLID